MSLTPSSKEQPTKSSTAARVTLTTGPAASSLEARKRKQKHQNVTDDPLGDQTTHLDPTQPTMTTISIPASAAQRDPASSPTPMVPYSPTEPDTSQSPLYDLMLDDTSPTSPKEEDSTPKCAHLTGTRSEASLTTTPTSTSSDTATALQTRLEALAKRFTSRPINKDASRDPIDKYTNCEHFPIVHDPHPAVALDNIDIECAVGWVHRPGDKLLAIPFDTEASELETHDSIKSRIFTTVTEITKADNIGIAGPTPSKEACRSPTSFLIYNLTDAQKIALLKCGVWSAPTLTFRVTTLDSPCLDFLFTIRGFTTHIIDEVQQMVYNIWTDETTKEFLTSTINTYNPSDQHDIATSISHFIESVTVTRLDLKTNGGALTPRFNIYARGKTIPNDDLWFTLRDFLAKRSYATALQGKGETVIAPFRCGICHGADHLRGLCPFPQIKDWNGPKNRPSATYATMRNTLPRKEGRGRNQMVLLRHD
ncbi:hypothetical protein F5148DRAFT_1154802 [Russula earlei]|uniref:Uncharacterized protein n=1 Tax=Russula earlei TaxID=71964 RepID=A0ACC0TQZ0_9AGAM|nr:hypothetical protein F5148DRAFT_1154802 [Russula earlei]